jgi:cytoskeleton protein RodZ
MTAEAASGVGGELASAREARGLTLAEVAQSLKFAPRQLEALEQERFSELPGGTFVRGMVRSYARLLKLDAEALVARLGGGPAEAANTGRLAERYREPVPFSDSARRSTFVYLGLSIAVLAGAGLFAWEWRSRMAAAKKPPVAAKPAAPKATATSAPKAAPRPAADEPVVEAPKKDKEAPKKDKEAPKKAEALPKPGPGVHRIVLRVEREAWIEVKDGAERLLVSSLNAAGTERVVQGRPPFTLVIGNAQHVRITYDDKPVDLSPYVKVEVARLTLP